MATHETRATGGEQAPEAANRALIAALREALRREADPAKAEPMRAYMKSAMPFLGVQNPSQRRVFRAVIPAFPLATFEEWRDTVLALWRAAEYREERYAAIALTEDRRYRRFQTPETLLLYEEMIVAGAWWDLVDVLASHQIGGLLRAYPETVGSVVIAWSESPDMWLRRTAIICQLGSKAKTDTDLLQHAIEANLADKEFFIRKAIGWALRELAKTDPEWVRRFVEEHAGRLSPLSRREATKHLVPLHAEG